MNRNNIEYCNWTFNECLEPSEKWLVTKDCGAEITLRRGDSKDWQAYKKSLEPHSIAAPPADSSKCPNCGKYINGVNPYDDGETWRK